MEKRIGKITHYFTRIGVAVLEIDEDLHVGDTIRILGHTTDLTQQVSSMEVEHQQMQTVSAGADVALKVDERVREDDVIYKVIDDRVTHF